MDFPAESAKKLIIKPGAVYYTTIESISLESHYFICINETPLEDKIILLMCSTSQVERARKRIEKREQPASTFVEISKIEYKDFKVDSAVDCNTCVDYSVDKIIEKFRAKSLELKEDISSEILNKLRKGFKDSPNHPDSIKRIVFPNL
ncbi:hypothetical protein ACFLS9_07760 [Bacteroidota bacterium]